ncbi:disintegrin and metalloproteinase domain-containing protein 8-like [Stylophora pistillata]|uniref:disintegrin and metalloproteinase domain-containing protein 8-like n=1 Tax=Stylophora pistillata TaxID=50429 RepID=UPI000C044290|nr:disintegrin and metalloproteinase domain-containing protein 8-like [Stylophora pistillata]
MYYRHFKNNRTAVEYRSKMIANIVDSLFRPLKVRIALTAVETWTQKDKIVVDSDSDKSLQYFMKYRNSELVKNYKHDNAQLLTSGGVVQDHSVSAAATAAILAHEMGHNFGFLHDEDIEGCKCDAPAADQGCIMSAVAKYVFFFFIKADIESSFRQEVQSYQFVSPRLSFNQQGRWRRTRDTSTKSSSECERYSDSCCNATTCKLHPTSECDSGPCCDKCKVKPQGSLCRDKVNECDLPEVCTGKSELCPINKYVQDGTTCANGEYFVCRSAAVSLGPDIPDPGETSEGTKCGENKLCIERKCVSIDALNAKNKPCPNNCSGENGICNNESECFCLGCWTGADCSVWVECRTEGTAQPLAERSKIAGILILVFILIFLIVGAVFAFIYREQLKEKWRTFKQKAPGSKRYQDLSRASLKQTRDRNGARAVATTNSEPPKLRPNISGPKLQSSTRKEPTVNVTPNPLGTSRFIAAKEEQPTSQPAVVFKPNPPKPELPKPPVVEKEKRPPNLPPVKLRNREWPPKGDKTASLNRASSPPSVTEPTRPVKPVKPPRPESHGGILDKPSVPPHPGVKAPREWPPRDKKNETQSNPAQASKVPASQPTVPPRPVPKAVKGPSEERPSSLPLKPSDIKKGLGTGNDRPISASNPVGPKKVPLKPPGPIPRRPGTKPA